MSELFRRLRSLLASVLSHVAGFLAASFGWGGVQEDYEDVSSISPASHSSHHEESEPEVGTEGHGAGVFDYQYSGSGHYSSGVEGYAANYSYGNTGYFLAPGVRDPYGARVREGLYGSRYVRDNQPMHGDISTDKRGMAPGRSLAGSSGSIASSNSEVGIANASRSAVFAHKAAVYAGLYQGSDYDASSDDSASVVRRANGSSHVSHSERLGVFPSEYLTTPETFIPSAARDSAPSGLGASKVAANLSGADVTDGQGVASDVSMGASEVLVEGVSTNNCSSPTDSLNNGQNDFVYVAEPPRIHASHNEHLAATLGASTYFAGGGEFSPLDSSKSATAHSSHSDVSLDHSQAVVYDNGSANVKAEVLEDEVITATSSSSVHDLNSEQGPAAEQQQEGNLMVRDAPVTVADAPVADLPQNSSGENDSLSVSGGVYLASADASVDSREGCTSSEQGDAVLEGRQSNGSSDGEIDDSDERLAPVSVPAYANTQDGAPSALDVTVVTASLPGNDAADGQDALLQGLDTDKVNESVSADNAEEDLRAGSYDSNCNSATTAFAVWHRDGYDAEEAWEVHSGAAEEDGDSIRDSDSDEDLDDTREGVSIGGGVSVNSSSLVDDVSSSQAAFDLLCIVHNDLPELAYGCGSFISSYDARGFVPFATQDNLKEDALYYRGMLTTMQEVECDTTVAAGFLSFHEALCGRLTADKSELGDKSIVSYTSSPSTNSKLDESVYKCFLSGGTHKGVLSADCEATEPLYQYIQNTRFDFLGPQSALDVDSVIAVYGGLSKRRRRTTVDEVLQYNECSKVYGGVIAEEEAAPTTAGLVLRSSDGETVYMASPAAAQDDVDGDSKVYPRSCIDSGSVEPVNSVVAVCQS